MTNNNHTLILSDFTPTFGSSPPCHILIAPPSSTVRSVTSTSAHTRSQLSSVSVAPPTGINATPPPKSLHAQLRPSLRPSSSAGHSQSTPAMVASRRWGSLRIIVGTIGCGILGFYVMHRLEICYKQKMEQRLIDYQNEMKIKEEMLLQQEDHSEILSD